MCGKSKGKHRPEEVAKRRTKVELGPGRPETNKEKEERLRKLAALEEAEQAKRHGKRA